MYYATCTVLPYACVLPDVIQCCYRYQYRDGQRGY